MAEWNVDDLMHRTFASIDAVEKFMQAFQEKSRTVFVRGRSTTLEYANLVGNVNSDLKYYTVEYNCKFGGKFRPKSTGQRKTSTFKKGCPACFKLHISDDRQTLEIRKVNLSHNHEDVPENLLHMIPERRKLPPAIRETVVNAIKLQCNKKLLQVKLKEDHGIHVTTKDLWNIQSTFKDRDDDVMKCINLLHEKGADVEVLIDRPASASPNGKEELKAIYFSTPDMRQSMISWCQIVFIDGTYLLLMLGLTVMILMVEDSNGIAEIVGVGLLVKEDRDTFEWFLETFKKVNQSAIPKIKCFMGDKDLLERDILKQSFPGIPIYICQFHVLRTFSREIVAQKYDINNDEKRIILTLLEKLVKSSSEQNYKQNYADFCEVAPAAIREYFDVNWHSIKEDWAQYCMVNGNLGNNTNNRLESMNGKIKQVVQRKSSLVQFVKDFFAFLESHNLQTSHKLLSNFLKKSTSYDDKEACEQNYMDYLTAYGFSQVLSEIEQLTHVSFVEEKNPNESFVFRWKNNCLTATTTTCECATFQSLMLPCRHIFAARRKLGLLLFDKKLCNERWTKYYYKKTQRVFNVTNLANDCTSTPQLNVKRLAPKVLPEKERLKAVSILTKSLQSIASMSTGSRFDCKVTTLKELNLFWKQKSKIQVLALDSIVESVEPADTSNKGAKKTVVSVPQKRKILKPFIDELVQTAHESIDEYLDERTKILQIIEEVWRSGSDVTMKIIKSHDSVHSFKDSIVTERIHCTNTERIAALKIRDAAPEKTILKSNANVQKGSESSGIEGKNLLPSFPPPVKVAGRPSLSLTTTVPRRKKKQPTKFCERNDRMQKEIMLGWVIPKRILKSVLDNEYLVQSSDIDLESIRESFLSVSIKLNLIEPYFDDVAFAEFKKVIQSKITKAVLTCGSCKEKLHSKSVLCESCLLWYHFECASLKRKPSSRITWFCQECKN